MKKPFSHKDNEAFIKHLKKGNEAAYVYLATKYNRKLFVYALSLTRDHADAQDIVQNVFLTVWKYRKRLNTTYSIKNFLYKTTYNEFVSHYHKKRALSKLEEAYLEGINESIQDDYNDILKRKIAIISDSIEKLPARCKETFILSKKEGLTNNEIAEYMNVSIKTVEVQITKAYTTLRKLVGEELKQILFFLFDFKKKEI